MKIETMYRMLVFLILVLLMLVGIYILIDVSKKESAQSVIASVSNEKITVKPYEEFEEETISEDDLIMDVSIVYTDVYPDCGHTIEQEEKHSNTSVNKVKEEVENKDLGYRLIGSEGGILIYQKVNIGKCRNHYKVVLEDNRVYVYRIGITGEYEPYQETEITVETIRDGIKEQLLEGIEVDELEELLLLIEDIES